MTDWLGTTLTILILAGAIGYALIQVYKWLKKEGIIGGKKMEIFGGQQQPQWEEYKNVAVFRNMPSLAEWQKKLEEGWELVAVEKPNYYFRKVK